MFLLSKDYAHIDSEYQTMINSLVNTVSKELALGLAHTCVHNYVPMVLLLPGLSQPKPSIKLDAVIFI